MLSKCPGVLSQPYLNLGSTIFEPIPGVFLGVFPSVLPDVLPGVFSDVFPGVIPVSYSVLGAKRCLGYILYFCKL